MDLGPTPKPPCGSHASLDQEHRRILPPAAAASRRLPWSVCQVFYYLRNDTQLPISKRKLRLREGLMATSCPWFTGHYEDFRPT